MESLDKRSTFFKILLVELISQATPVDRIIDKAYRSDLRACVLLFNSTLIISVLTKVTDSLTQFKIDVRHGARCFKM